jgi:hypothetical protein
MQSLPAPRIQSSEAIVTSTPWIQLTGGFGRQAILYKGLGPTPGVA